MLYGRNLAVIIGAQNSGTTSLFSYLAQHPKICPCSVKEPAFFAGPASDVDNFERGLEWYRRLWSWRPNHLWGVEASPFYTMYDNAAKAASRMCALRPEWRFKLIYLLRNPVDRIESEYRHGIPGGWIPRRYAAGNALEIFPPSLLTSRYALHLREYRKRFSDNDVKLVLTEKLEGDPAGTVAEVLTFLELDASSPIDISRQHNVSTQEYALWIQALANETPMGRLLPLYRTLPNWSKRLIKTLPSQRIRLTPGQRDIAWRQLTEDVNFLQDEFGIDVKRWRHDSVFRSDR